MWCCKLPTISRSQQLAVAVGVAPTCRKDCSRCCLNLRINTAEPHWLRKKSTEIFTTSLSWLWAAHNSVLLLLLEHVVSESQLSSMDVFPFDQADLEMVSMMQKQALLMVPSHNSLFRKLLHCVCVKMTGLFPTLLNSHCLSGDLFSLKHPHQIFQ